ncbi:LPS export ABC transporter periplasmic protein LptC [Paracandidimonas soli]|uniref:LPS export ABC transporter periplasmic protein LptC n=1 Tax=Paracandidimonas soli TaxID=1917182 RepID=UPI003341D82C
MRDRLPGLIALVLLLLLVAGTWWAADYTHRSILQDPPRRVTHEPDSWAREFVMLRSDPKGRAINRLEGDYMVHYPDDDSYEITQPRAAGQQDGAPVTTGTADMAVMDQDGARIVMRGNARVNRQGDKERMPLEVTSETLTLLTDEDVVLTDEPAVVLHGNSVMKGNGMRYDNKTRQLQVHSASDVKISGRDRRAPSNNNSADADKAQ